MKAKKIALITLLILLIAGVIFAAVSMHNTKKFLFTDVDQNDWFYDEVKFVFENDLMSGTSETTFEPDSNITRAMLIAGLGRLANIEWSATEAFSDVSPDDWYSGYVDWAIDIGIVTVYVSGTFDPDKTLTREEMAIAVDNFIKYLDYRMIKSGGVWPFSDQSKVARWAESAVAELRCLGIVEGDQYGNFNPKENTTRAEVAAILMRIKHAIDNAYKGYLPEGDSDMIVLGASYLYWNGSACAGGMAHDLNVDGTYPILETYLDSYAAMKTYHHPNTVGVSLSYLNIDVAKNPYVKIAYKYEGEENKIPTAAFISNKTKSEIKGFEEPVVFRAGESDRKMKTAIADLSSVPEAHSDYNASNIISNLIFTPFDLDYEGSGKFNILYIGFFKTLDEAKSFNVRSDKEISSYLKKYEPHNEISWNEYTADISQKYDKILIERINEIKNSESALTPEMVTAKGGTCYYISSINGDDNNNGLSPENAWKTPRALFDVYDENEEWDSKLKKGDGVFFERGSVFYATCFGKSSSDSGVVMHEGCYYGAYGEGAKPIFTTAHDLTASNGTGIWKSSGYDNIWVFDCAERTGDVGRIYFNGGEAVGVKVVSQGNEQTFGPGFMSSDKGYCCNGYEYYYSGNTDMTNPGTALRNNLEFFYDSVTNKVYLYWDKGNPSDFFTDIKIPRTGTAAWIKDNCTVDNLAFMYCTHYGARSSGTNVRVTNCEIGYVGGSVSSVESGIEIYGSTNGAYFHNNYIHDIGDGALTSQSGGGSVEYPNQIQNIEYVGNVMVACGHSAEVWNGIIEIDQNGYSTSKITNVLIKDNIRA